MKSTVKDLQFVFLEQVLLLSWNTNGKKVFFFLFAAISKEPSGIFYNKAQNKGKIDQACGLPWCFIYEWLLYRITTVHIDKWYRLVYTCPKYNHYLLVGFTPIENHFFYYCVLQSIMTCHRENSRNGT